MDTFKKYLKLFWAFFKIGLFTFGGGYAMISVISNEIVEKRKYIDEDEFADVVAIAESTPGPIAINSATYIGYKRGGVFGAILSSIAVTLPSLIIIYIISLFLDKFMEFELVQKAFKGIQCAVAVLIVTASFKLYKTVKKNVLSYILIAFAALALLAIDIFSLDISSIFIILTGAVCGIITFFTGKKKEEKPEPLTEQKPADNAIIAQNEPETEEERGKKE